MERKAQTASRQPYARVSGLRASRQSAELNGFDSIILAHLTSRGANWHKDTKRGPPWRADTDRLAARRPVSELIALNYP